MPRQQGIVVENSFVRGLITEATGLNFPENACTDTDNCVFDPLGTVKRRGGFRYEKGFKKESISSEEGVVNCFLWENVSGDGNVSFVVVQIFDTLYFYRVGAGLNISNSLHEDTIDLSDYSPANAPAPGLYDCQFSSGDGVLFVTHPFLETFYVSYDANNDTISDTEILIEIRDLEGDLTDTEAVDARPSDTLGSLDANHHYNLLNQGWTTATLTAWDTARSDMPSNADVSWYYKDADDAFDFSTVDNKSVGTSKAPRGHYVFNLYDVDRNSIVSGATSQSISHKRLSTSAFFAGRVFYSGLNEQGYDAKIYFSQILEERSQYGKCYQVNDPTSELLFDLLPSDGGMINIINGGRIIKLFPYLNTLIVLTTNGVWAISGSQGIGFTANDYSVNRISSVPAISYKSIVDVEGVPIWWNQEGIYTIAVNNNTGGLGVISLSDQTIRSFYRDEISPEAKVYAYGVYDHYKKVVQWLYRRVPSTTAHSKYEYDAVLNYNILTQAFYPWTMESGEALMGLDGAVVVRGIQGTFDTFNVVDDEDNVLDGTDNVVQDLFQGEPQVPTIKYLMHDDSDGLTFAEIDDSVFQDWIEEDPTDYESFFITGYKVRGDAQRKFQTNQVYVYTENKRENRYKFQGRFDYATAGNTGRWSTNNVNVPSGNYEIVKRKLKVRGHGIAVQYKITSIDDYPFDVVGWSALDSVNQLP